MERWGRLVARRRWVVLAIGLLTTIAAAGWGLGVFGSLSDGGFEDPESESARADAAIVAAFGRADADLLVLYTSENGTRVDDPAFEQAVTETLAALPAQDVVTAITTYDGGAGLVSEDGMSTLVPLTLAGADDDERAVAYDRISESSGPLASASRSAARRRSSQTLAHKSNPTSPAPSH